eukprot:GHVS01061843.1.p1 GENE.GHVS01061843.1~~GHVS01061843.1.p1  ORF type:complete len:448 (-),score=111.75 GHVS01061843.1:994-2337(-)
MHYTATDDCHTATTTTQQHPLHNNTATAGATTTTTAIAPQNTSSFPPPHTTTSIPPAPQTTTNATALAINSSSGGGRGSRYAVGGGGRRAGQKIYDTGKVLGNGSFGVVCEARCLETGEQVAIKKVLQDPRYKNRELDIMKELKHPNVVELKDYFYTESTAPTSSSSPPTATTSQQEPERYLNVVMEHIPETVYRVMKTFVRNSQHMPIILVKVYAFQMCRALGYLHALGICHRDIKPQNLLVDSRSHVLKLCDFGSAKRLMPGEHSVAYICSRFYRAPELMLGATEYETAIDVWSIGCVLGELLLGRPLFAGETSVDQLVKIIQVLGTPSRKQMSAMNPNYTEFRFPDVKPRDWKKVFDEKTPSSAIDLLTSFLKYEPSERIGPLEALAHPFFDELRSPDARLPNGAEFPELFSLTERELAEMSPEVRRAALPHWASSAAAHHPLQ